VCCDVRPPPLPLSVAAPFFVLARFGAALAAVVGVGLSGGTGGLGVVAAILLTLWPCSVTGDCLLPPLYEQRIL
jgi:hypothetical protein